jgi:acyl carrier protein
MMSERTTEERIKDAINEIVTLPENAGRDTELKSLNLDSLDVTELVMEVEDEFDGVTVEDDVVEKWETIGNIIDYVEGKLA